MHLEVLASGLMKVFLTGVVLEHLVDRLAKEGLEEAANFLLRTLHIDNLKELVLLEYLDRFFNPIVVGNILLNGLYVLESFDHERITNDSGYL